MPLISQFNTSVFELCFYIPDSTLNFHNIDCFGYVGTGLKITELEGPVNQSKNCNGSWPVANQRKSGTAASQSAVQWFVMSSSGEILCLHLRHLTASFALATAGAGATDTLHIIPFLSESKPFSAKK